MPNVKKNKPKSRWHSFGQWVLWTVSSVSALGLLLASFGGSFNPASFHGICFMVLTLPLWIGLWIISTILNAFWCRKALILSAITFILCAGAMWNYCPLNVFGPSSKKYADCKKFTLLTYNIASFNDLTGQYPGGINPTVSYIINSNADIVCLQETEVKLTGPFDRFHITPAQIDSINNIYPYRLVYGGFLTLLSKFPARPIHTPPLATDRHNKWRNYPIGVFRVDIDGTPVTIFNVHLQSYELSRDDKNLYRNITDGSELSQATDGSFTQSLRDIKKQIYQKVQAAAVNRAREAEILGKYIEKFGGPNVIVAGDFNDVPGCYTLRHLHGFKLNEVYPRVGFGPMITFNADKFYFRIDHVLFRGCLAPLQMKRGSIKYSDHYPLLTTFALTQNNK